MSHHPARALLGLVLAVAISGCGQQEPPAVDRMTLNDGATPAAPGASGLSSGFDRSTNEMSATLPVSALRTAFPRIETKGAGRVVPSSAAGCNPDTVTTPSLPSTEVVATKPLTSDTYEAELAVVAAARATYEADAEELMSAIEKAAQECKAFKSELRDLGEGSLVPAEEGTSRLTEYSEGDWNGLRVSTDVTLTGRSWSQQTTREALVVRRGQVVVLVRATKPEGAWTLVESLAKETLDGIDALS